jgi:hypothetical protein
MITTPVINELGSPTSYDHYASGIPFVHQFSGRPGWPEELPVRSDEPIVQPLTSVAERVGELIVGPAMQPSSDDM